jgi:hypothetical protein
VLVDIKLKSKGGSFQSITQHSKAICQICSDSPLALTGTHSSTCSIDNAVDTAPLKYCEYFLFMSLSGKTLLMFCFEVEWGA